MIGAIVWRLARPVIAAVVASSVIVAAMSQAYAAPPLGLQSLAGANSGPVESIRFISPDPWDPTVPGVGTNRYAYSDNDPINKSDPSGHCPICVPLGLAAIGALLGSTTEANAPGPGDPIQTTTDAEMLVNMAVGASLGVSLGRMAAAPSRGVLADDLSYAQRTYSERFSAIGRQKYSEVAGTKIDTIDDLASALRSGKVRPEQISVETARVNGQGYIVNTRTAKALERAGIPRSKWSVTDVTDDEAAMGRLLDQLGRNEIAPGQSISSPSSSGGGGGSASPGTQGNDSASEEGSGGLLGAIGRSLGLW